MRGGGSPAVNHSPPPPLSWPGASLQGAPSHLHAPGPLLAGRGSSLQLRRARQDTVEPQTLSRDDPEHHAPVLPPRGRAERQPGRRRVTAATSPARFPPQPIPLGPSPSLSVLPVTTHSGCDRPRTCIRSAGKGKGGGGTDGQRLHALPCPSNHAEQGLEPAMQQSLLQQRMTWLWLPGLLVRAW